MWWIAIPEFIVSTLVSFIATTLDADFMSKTSDLCMVADGLRVFLSMHDRLDRGIDDLNFFPFVCKAIFDSILAFVVFYRGQKVYCSVFDVHDPFFSVSLMYCGG